MSTIGRSTARKPPSTPSKRDRLSVVVTPAAHPLAREIRRAARHALRSQQCRQGRLEVAIVGDTEMRRQHGRWKGRRAATDVLSFDLREHAEPNNVDGQLIVCETVARRVAKTGGTNWGGELLLYVVHGCLHLCGHDDRRRGDAAMMHAAEDAILSELGWGPVYSGE